MNTTVTQVQPHVDEIQRYIDFLTGNMNNHNKLLYARMCRNRMIAALYPASRYANSANLHIVNAQQRTEVVKEYSFFWVKHELPLPDAFASEFVMHHVALLHVFSLPYERLQHCSVPNLQLRYYFLQAVDGYLTKNPYGLVQNWDGVFRLARLTFVHNVPHALDFWCTTFKLNEQRKQDMQSMLQLGLKPITSIHTSASANPHVHSQPAPLSVNSDNNAVATTKKKTKSKNSLIALLDL